MSNVPFTVQEMEPLGAGETITYTCKWEGATSVADTAVYIYRDGSDTNDVSTLMPGGSFGVDGNVVTLKPLVVPATDGGKEYMIVVQNTVDGDTRRGFMKVRILRPWTGA